MHPHRRLGPAVAFLPLILKALTVQVRRLAGDGQSQNSALSSLGMYDGHVIECAIQLQDSDRIEVFSSLTSLLTSDDTREAHSFLESDQY